MSSSRQGPEQDRRPGRRGRRPGTTPWPAAASATGRVIVEGFIDFDYEITQLTVRALGASGGRDALLRPHRPRAGERRLRGELAAAPDEPAALERSRQIAKAVTDNLGGQGLFGVELFVKGDQVWFSEVSPRPHDTGMVTMITQWQNEFELHARAILGLPVDTTLKSPGASAVIYGGVDATGIVFDGVADALRRAGQRSAPVRQAGELRQAPHGRGPGARCRRRVARTQAKLAASKVKPRQHGHGTCDHLDAAGAPGPAVVVVRCTFRCRVSHVGARQTLRGGVCADAVSPCGTDGNPMRESPADSRRSRPG
jgi:hypothetical protein